MAGHIAPKIRCATCQIREKAVCSKCSMDEVAELDTFKTYRQFRAGEVIIFAEQELDYVATIVEGAAVLSTSLNDGRRQMVGLLLPSDFLGWPGRDNSVYHVTAAVDTLLCCFHRKKFESFLRKSPDMSERLLEMMMDELDAAREWMLLLGRKSAREKIVSFILMLSERNRKNISFYENNLQSVDLMLSRESIADFLGLTIETVSRQISTLKNEQLIRLLGPRHIEILDHQRLLDEVGEDFREKSAFIA